VVKAAPQELYFLPIDVSMTESRPPDLSVIIVNWNTRELLRRCLDSLIATSGDLRLQLIVVDNGSRDGSQTMLRSEYPDVLLIENAMNAGFARANNQGAAVATAPLLLLLNSDAAVLPTALQAATSYMEANPSVGIVGCQLLNDDRSLQAPGETFPTLISTIVSMLPLPVAWRARYEQNRSSRDYSLTAFVDTVYGAALLIRRNLFAALGGFDERFYFTGEEIDLCWRARKSGYDIAYLPSAQAIHSVGGSIKRMPSIRHGLLTQRGRYMLLQRQAPRWQVAVLYGYLVVFTAARLLRWSLRVLRHGNRANRTTAYLYARELLWLLRDAP
jgi:GT2 family glycosyltransferase